MKTLVLFVILISSFTYTMAQHDTRYVRIAKLIIDSAYLVDYEAALSEHAEKAVKVEPGVLMLYGVHDKNEPTHVTVFEIYASKDAYNLHIKAPHFLKYKATVQHMVKSLELVDVVPISLQVKK